MIDVSEFLGARDQVDIDVVEERDGFTVDRERDDTSEILGDPGLWVRTDCTRGRKGVIACCLAMIGVEEFDRLVVRWRDANVDPCMLSGPDTDRVDDDIVDIRLLDLLCVPLDPENARLEVET